jgi:SAM-dependent methyltransferase
MEEPEFDKFAAEYWDLHAANIRLSGEDPDYFAQYKVAEVARDRPALTTARAQILDFGAGTGNAVRFFRKQFPDAALTCLDVSKKSPWIGESRFSQLADFVHFDGRTIPFPDEQFDVTFALCVFHHIAKSEHPRLLAELRRVTRTGGRLFVFEHNPFNPLTVHAVNTCAFDENAVLLRPLAFARSVATAGFAATRVRFHIFFPHFLRALRPLERWMQWLPLGAQYCVVARKL